MIASDLGSGFGTRAGPHCGYTPWLCSHAERKCHPTTGGLELIRTRTRTRTRTLTLTPRQAATSSLTIRNLSIGFVLMVGEGAAAGGTTLSQQEASPDTGTTSVPSPQPAGLPISLFVTEATLTAASLTLRELEYSQQRPELEPL